MKIPLLVGLAIATVTTGALAQNSTSTPNLLSSSFGVVVNTSSSYNYSSFPSGNLNDNTTADFAFGDGDANQRVVFTGINAPNGIGTLDIFNDLQYGVDRQSSSVTIYSSTSNTSSLSESSYTRVGTYTLTYNHSTTDTKGGQPVSYAELTGLNIAAGTKSLLLSFLQSPNHQTPNEGTSFTEIEAPGLVATAQTIFDAGFETPATSYYVFNPTGTAWTFSGNSGVQRNGSSLYAPAAQDGAQTAFILLSGGTNGSISQTVNFPSTGSFTVSFAAAGSSNYGVQSISVKIDGAVVGSFTPASTTSFTSYTTSPFTISATGNHILSFVGTGTGSSSLMDFIDSVALQTAGGAVAVPANNFLNSMGINIHISQGVPESTYESLLTYTGIRNVRDASTGSTSSYVTLHQHTGVLFDIIGINLPNLISDSTALSSAGALLAIEGPNEPNNWPFVYNGQTGGGSGTWVPVANFQRDLYSQVKANSTLKNYPVFSVSEEGAETDNVGLQWLTIPSGAGCLLPDGTQFADYANVHNYVCGNSGAYVDNNAWNASSPTPVSGSSVDGLYGEFAGVTWAHQYTAYATSQALTLPRVTTETGWTTGSGGLTQDQQGKVFLNLYLAAYKRGWAYTFIYQMRDNEGGGTNTWGIYNADSTPKLAATYIHNLSTILADTISSNPGFLAYTIPSEATIPTVHDLLLQKSNGVFYLAVWDERPVGEGTDSVTVNLGKSFASVSVYDPTVGTTATQTLSNVNSITLTMSDHPLVIAVH